MIVIVMLLHCSSNCSVAVRKATPVFIIDPWHFILPNPAYSTKHTPEVICYTIDNIVSPPQPKAPVFLITFLCPL